MKKRISNFKLSAIAFGVLLANSSAFAASTTLVSGVSGKNIVGTSKYPAITVDGSKVAFVSNTGALVGDSSSTQHVYLKDLSTGTIKRLSISSNGTAGNSISFNPSVSGDGQKVVYYSLATNLVSGDTNNKSDVFLRNLQNNTTTLISSSSSGTIGNNESTEAVISRDGNYVAFSSLASNLTGVNTNGKRNVYVKNLSTGKTELVSVNNAGQVGDGDSFAPAISDDGRYVAFASIANNFPSSNGNKYDIYVYDRQTKTTEIITQGSNGHSGQATISGNGRYVAFISQANNLISGDTNNQIDVIVYDRTKKVYKSVQNAGVVTNGPSFYPKLSQDGRFMAFYSGANNLVSGDMNARNDLFILDLALNKIELASVSTTGAQIDNNIDSIFALNGDGRYAVFSTTSSLDTADNNSQLDVYKRNRDAFQSVTPVAKIAALPAQECTNGSAYVTLDGRSSTEPTNAGTYTWSGSFGTKTGKTASVYLGVGTHTVSLTVENDWGSSTTSMNVTVSDSFAPTVSADAPVSLEATSSKGAAHTVGISASDACELTGTTVTPSPAYYPLGTTNVTVTASDTVGLTASDNTSVTVKDTKAPSLTTPANKTVEANAVRTSVNIGTASASDYFLKSVTNNAPADFPLNTTNVTWTAVDTSGNKTSKVQQITITDTTKPVLNVPVNINAEATAALSSVNIGSANASDIFPVTISNNAPATFPVGTTTVTWTAKDANNNAASANQLVTLTDSTAPIITAPADMIVEATGVETSVSLGNATASDVVGVVNISNDAPTTFPIGETVITWTATDAAGNSSLATQRVIVQDTIAPVISTPVNVNVEAAGEQSAVVIETPNATDAVGIVSLTNDSPATFPVGTTKITWTAKDAAGNTSTAIQTVTVEDTTAPEISTPVNVTVEATAPESIVVYEAPTATDAVGVVSLTNDAPAKFPVGTTTITWTAKDAAGNTSTVTQTVTVKDSTAPDISTPVNVTVEATAPESTVVYQAPVATDAVGVVSLSNDAPAKFPVGTTTITWTAKDAAGNSSTATQTVTVTDMTPPVISTPVNVEVEATANMSVVNYQVPTATDIVGVTSFTSNAPATFPVGTTVITWTAKDAAGNVTTATQTVKVNDTTPPALTLPANMTVEANGNPSSIANLGAAKAIDIVDGDISANIQVTEPAAGYQLGANTVKYSITDKAGNVSTGSQTVTILDRTAPEFSVSPASLIEVIATGELTEVQFGQAEATDFYLESVSNDHPSTQFPIGETVVTWTAKDTSGNTSTYKQTIRVNYRFDGFVTGVKNGGIYKGGRVLPVKVKLAYADGSPVEVAQPVISVFKTSNDEVVGDALDISSSSAADSGVTMRHVGDGYYMYNLETQSLGKGTYMISITPNKDGNAEAIHIALK